MNLKHTTRKGIIRQAIVFALALGVGLVAITGQSLWIDEGNTVFRAMMPDLSSWWRMVMHMGGSDIQMPAYMIMVWAWEKAGAGSEYALRMVNLPWIIIGALALSRVRYWPLVFLASPFVWYYASELRPYAMQIACGAIAGWAMLRVAEAEPGDERTWHGLHATALAVVLLLASSLSAAVWAAGLGLGVIVLRPDWLMKLGFWLRILPWGIVAGSICGFYIYTLMEGYRATASGGGGLLGLMFGFYELAGMTGLGPGRNEIRENPAVVLKWLPLFGPFAIALGLVWLHGVWQWTTRSTRRAQISVALALLTPILVLSAVGLLMDFRVLGRHLSPMLPAVLLPLALAMEKSARRGVPGFRALAFASVAVLLASAISVRVSQRHARDDFRAATNLAIDAMLEGKTVLWLADMNTPRYYAHRRGGLDYVHRIQKWESDRPPSLFYVDLVVINRPDIHIRNPGYATELRDNFFIPATPIHGFETWKPR